MNKFLFFIPVIALSLIQNPSSAKENSLGVLSERDIKKYGTLEPQEQTNVLQLLKKMGHYDNQHTHLDSTGRFFIVDDSYDQLLEKGEVDPPLNSPSTKKVISDNPPSGYTPEGIPIFHSFPGSPNVIYLNFLGGTITGTAWNRNYREPIYFAQPYIPVAYNPDRTPGFPPAVQNAIASIWSRVAEDYAPWQIDVTTEAPTTYTTRTAVALITNSVTTDGKSMPAGTSGGVAYFDVFGFRDHADYRPALIYYDRLAGGNEDVVATVISHEIGHNFGLSHNGTLSGGPYYSGAGSGEISWGCIMGAAYFRTVVKFCNGDYPDANNHEDQLSIISAHAPLRDASAGTSLATATPLSITNNAFKFTGIIQDYVTSNFFALPNISGTLTASARTFRSKVNTLGNNLCLGFRIINSAGSVLISSSNSQSCSATLTINSLPLDTYYIQIYPLGNLITPFPRYGSVGQYDLVGTASTNVLQLFPQYTTLALGSTLSFDENDTTRVVGGTPPYTYSAQLNSFTSSGTTFLYTAAKPGIDTLTVTDARGNRATAKVTISHIDFGGMYGYSKIGNYNNPLTGTLGCPAGYTSQAIMGTVNIDYPLYYCYRPHVNGIAANYDFGGIYSNSGTGLRPNPLTGAGSCPNGYSSSQVFGENSHNPDYPAYFCYKKHDEAVPEAASFAGMYAPAYRRTYNNPVTGGQSCPSGTASTMMLGTANVDYPFYFCTYPMTSIKLTPEYTNLALNNTMTFDANDNVRVSGGVPPYTYSAVLGSFNRTRTTYTYTASKPGLDTLTVTDATGNTATAKVTVAFMDFGGMYGYGAGGNFNNPTTGTLGCPSGYSPQQVLGTFNVDYPIYYCYRMHAKAVPADYDFGGMYSSSSAGLRPNPMTNAGSCPSGYTSAQVLGTSNNNPDYPAYMCYKTHNESVAEAVHFAGMYGHGYGYYGNFNNPATNALSCPTGWVGAMMLGTYNVDYPFYFCY